MKRNLLLLTLTLVSFMTYAQFEVRETNTDNLITDGQNLTFSEAGCEYSDPCNWKFKVTNTSTEPIFMRIFVDGLTGTDGADFQLCFAGVCLNSVTLGSGYPSTAVLIAPGATNVAGNNMWNLNDPSITTPMSWTFRFQAFDSSGFEMGSPLTLTYQYEPNLSVDDFAISNIKVFPSIATNEINVVSAEDLTAVFYNMLGKKVKTANIVAGTSKINVSGLASQPYIVQFSNNAGERINKKIVIQ